MGTTRAGSESRRTLIKNNSGTYILSVPILNIRVLGWKEGQKLVVKQSGKKLIIEDWKDK